MTDHFIIVRVNGVHRDEINELKDHLENNYWDWKEITEPLIKIRNEKLMGFVNGSEIRQYTNTKGGQWVET